MSSDEDRTTDPDPSGGRPGKTLRTVLLWVTLVGTIIGIAHDSAQMWADFGPDHQVVTRPVMREQ